MTITFPTPNTPGQGIFISLGGRFTLFAGGMGSGRTECLIRCLLIDSLTDLKSDTVLVVHPLDCWHMTHRHIPRLLQGLERLQIPYTHDKNNQSVTIDSAARTIILFRPLSRPDLVIGYKADSVYIDDLSDVPIGQQMSLYLQIRGRLKDNGKLKLFCVGGELDEKLLGLWTNATTLKDYRYIRVPTLDNTYLSTEIRGWVNGIIGDKETDNE